MASKVKAVFVGITYEHMKTGTVQPLDRIPYIYAKKFMENLIFKGAFTKEQCVLLTDWNESFGLPTKDVVKQAIKNIIANADKSGDSILFYYCGHGAAYQDPDTKKFIQRDGHWGFLKTLKLSDDPKVYLVDEFFDTEFREIINEGLAAAPKVNLSIFIHACHGGVMFVSPYQKPDEYVGKGIALSAVNPTIPSAIKNPSNNDFSSRRDFTVFLVEDVVKKLSGERGQWPTYKEVLAVLVERSAANPAHNGVVLEPVLYHDPSIDPAKLRFLAIP